MNKSYVLLMCLVCTTVPIFGRLDQQLINKWTKEDVSQWDQKKVDSMMEYLKKNAKGNESTIRPVRKKIENRWIDELKTRKATIEPVLAKAKIEKNKPQELKAQTSLATTVDNLIKIQTESAANLAPEADTPAEKKELAEKQQEIAQLKETKQKLEAQTPIVPTTTVTPPPIPATTTGAQLPPPFTGPQIKQPAPDASKLPPIPGTQPAATPGAQLPPPFTGGTSKLQAPDASKLPPIPGTQPAVQPKAPTLITQSPSILLPPPPPPLPQPKTPVSTQPTPQQKPSTAGAAAQGITPEQLQAIRSGADLKPVGPSEKQKPVDPFLAALEQQREKLKKAEAIEKPKEVNPLFEQIKEAGKLKSDSEKEDAGEWDEEPSAQPTAQTKETPAMQQAHQRAQENLAKALTILENEKATQAEKDTVNSLLNEGLKAANTLVDDQQEQYKQLKDALFALKGKNTDNYRDAITNFNALSDKKKKPATIALAERAKKVATIIKTTQKQSAPSTIATKEEPKDLLKESVEKRRKSVDVDKGPAKKMVDTIMRNLKIGQEKDLQDPSLKEVMPDNPGNKDLLSLLEEGDDKYTLAQELIALDEALINLQKIKTLFEKSDAEKKKDLETVTSIEKTAREKIKNEDILYHLDKGLKIKKEKIEKKQASLAIKPR